MRIAVGEGRYLVWLEQYKIGSDVLFILGGGEKTHIGGILISEPGQSLKTIRLGNHYDYIALKPIIEKARDIYKTTIVATGGIHINNATKDEIKIIIENCISLSNQIEKI
jgi:hypothetical protein